MTKRDIVAALLGAAMLVAPAAVAAEAVELAVGESKTVKLPGNPTTGFLWSVAECSDVVKVELALEKAAPDAAPLCGRPSATVVTLTGQKAGQGVVKLNYARPWEKDEEPALSRTITVTVK